MLNEHKNSLETVNIIPSSGGVFEVKLDDKLIFSKKESNRFPNDNEVEALIRENLA
ncbi:Rdx family protein [Tissierella carlieri]|nr:Rdx family protein [Tissierella carlieri]